MDSRKVERRLDQIAYMIHEASLELVKLRSELSHEDAQGESSKVTEITRSYTKYEKWRDQMRKMKVFTAKELAEEMGASTVAAHNHIRRAIRVGTIVRRGKPKSPNTYYEFQKKAPGTDNVVKMEKPRRTGGSVPIKGTGKGKKITADAEIRSLVAVARAARWEVSGDGKHIKIKAPDGTIVTAPKTPSDHRAAKNVRAQLRKAGLIGV